MYNATLAKKIEITPDLLIVGVRPDSGVPTFLPGQYLALGLLGSEPRPVGAPPLREETPADKIIKRAYSIGSSPDQREILEFYIAVVRDGSFTSRLANLQEGARLFAAPKVVGTFTINEVPADHNLVLVATGTGLAPYISMLRTPSTWTPGRNITVIHGVRYPADLGYSEELQAFERTKKGFRYLPVVSRGGDSWGGLKGYAQHLFRPEGLAGEQVKLDTSKDHVFLCGNPGMVEEAEAMLVHSGFKVHAKKEPGNLHVEKYW
jgi:ferredoxin--NADP+ reductase